MTTTEAAAILGVHPYTVTRWCTTGRLAAVRGFCGYEIHLSEVELRAIVATFPKRSRPVITAGTAKRGWRKKEMK